MADVLIYTGPLCGFCHRAKRLLSDKGVDFKEISIAGDSQAREEMMQRSGRHTVPQIWIDERHVGGCDDLFALEYNGELDLLLGEVA